MVVLQQLVLPLLTVVLFQHSLCQNITIGVISFYLNAQALAMIALLLLFFSDRQQPMDQTALQNEINHLLFLYFTAVGVIQRDAHLLAVHKHIDSLVDEIARCKERIDALLETSAAEESLPEDFAETIEQGRSFVEDGRCFIDRIIEE
ncbi:hypothetical protein PAPHI01_2502 [Pancytospora philotis]|nr:hypothetical protein PAPHI01_2502 [Pancytospora philotis]